MAYEQLLIERITEQMSIQQQADTSTMKTIRPFCNCKKDFCDKMHGKECGAEVKRLTGLTVLCKEKTHDDMDLNMCDFDKGYKTLAHFEPVHEILLVPVSHVTNEDLIIDGKFWRVCVIMIIRLENLVLNLDTTFRGMVVSKIAWNFGEWESRVGGSTTSELGPLDRCHGHAHFQVVLNAWEILSTTYPVLRGRTKTPEEYLEQRLGEIRALLDHARVDCQTEAMSVVSEQMAETNKNMVAMNNNMAETNKYMAEMNKNMAEMSKNMAEMSKTMAEMNKHMAEMSKNMAVMSSNIAASNTNSTESTNILRQIAQSMKQQ
jgi:hypothetical protein